MKESTAGADGTPRIGSGAALTAWAWEQHLAPSAKLLLLAIADNAGKSGAWMFGAQKEMAIQTGMSERSVRSHLAALEDLGLIRRQAVYESGYRMPDHILLATQESVPANFAGSKTPANRGSVPANLASGKICRAQSSSSEVLSLEDDSLKKKEAAGEICREMLDDASTLLRERRQVARKIVSEREMLIAAAALSEFNRQAGSDFGLGANMTAIVMRIRDRPSWDAAKHVRLVQSAWRIRWWERNGGRRRATPAVIYGERAFERVVQDAADEAAGRLVAPDMDLRTKVWPDGRTFDQLTPSGQAEAREQVARGLKPWLREPEPVLVVSNGHGPVLTAANFADLD